MTVRPESLLVRPDQPDQRHGPENRVDPLDPWPSGDALGEALRFLRMTGAFYGRSELSEPWGLTVPALPEHLWLHAPLRGRCWLEAEGAEPCVLQPGDVALVPHGDGHRLLSEPGTSAPSILGLERENLSGRYEVLRHGGGGEAALLVCAAVRLGGAAAPNVRRLLPRVLRVGPAGTPQVEWMHSLLRLMATEAEASRPGSEAVVTRLADIVVVLAIRAWMDSEPGGRAGWLSALRDRQIGRALTLIHRHPERAWTVDSLARQVAMSRSAFANRFAELVGEPPIRYLLGWRMRLALSALQDEDVTVSRLAQRLGYDSEAAFSRAFKRTMGVSPGAARRSAAAASAPRFSP
jgi:AraC-like DNA-binding protein